MWEQFLESQNRSSSTPKLDTHLMKNTLDTVGRFDNPLFISVCPFPATHVTQVSVKGPYRSDDGVRNTQRDSLSRVPGGGAKRRSSLTAASAQVAPGRHGSVFDDMQVIWREAVGAGFSSRDKLSVHA